jgi:hypothetical protein
VVVSFAAAEAWDALLGVKTAEVGTAAAAVGGGWRRCPLLPPLFYSSDCGGSSIQMKNSPIYPFNLQSNIVTSISLLLLVQI